MSSARIGPWARGQVDKISQVTLKILLDVENPRFLDENYLHMVVFLHIYVGLPNVILGSGLIRQHSIENIVCIYIYIL